MSILQISSTPFSRGEGFISCGEVVVTATSGKEAKLPEWNGKRKKENYDFIQLFKLLYDFQLKEISAEMHGYLERFFVHRPVSHFHRLIDVFYRVSVTE